MRVAVVTSHPIQYHSPWFVGLAERCDLHVHYAHRQSAEGQAEAGYGVKFDWDVDLLGGHEHSFLDNRAKDPNVYRFAGCDTPEVGDRLRAGRYDAVIITGWYLKSYLQALAAARRQRLPVLVRGDSQLSGQRGLPLRAAKQVVYRLLMRQYAAFLTVGTRNRAYLRHYGAPAERIFHTPHFVDNQFFEAGAAEGAKDREGLRSKMGAGADDVAVLFVGRLLDLKRPLDLLRAVARLPSNHVAVFVGSGEQEAEIRRLAGTLKVRAKLLGFRNQSELPALYAAADMLALPSDDTWGLVVNESMASGTPAVVSDAAGCLPDMIEDGRTGYGFPHEDIERFAMAIEKTAALPEDPKTTAALRAKVQAHSRDRAVEGTLQALQFACERQ